MHNQMYIMCGLGNQDKSVELLPIQLLAQITYLYMVEDYWKDSIGSLISLKLSNTSSRFSCSWETCPLKDLVI